MPLAVGKKSKVKKEMGVVRTFELTYLERSDVPAGGNVLVRTHLNYRGMRVMLEILHEPSVLLLL